MGERASGAPEEPRPEVYSHGYGASMTGAMAQRTAEREAAFFLPHLRPGMAVLDCGCGPGSITLGLAAVVAPGPVVGIDLGAGPIGRARAAATARGVANVRFEVGSAYAVPLPAGAVDAVFVHNVLQHLHDPRAALAEVHRVLRPGGVVGVRDSDHGSTIRAPTTPLLDESAALYLRWWQHNGGHPYVGRELRRLLREAGFGRIASTASTWCFAAPEGARQWGEGVAQRYTDADFTEQAVALGWSDRATLEAAGAAWRAWGADPDSFEARIACEAVGWRD